VKLRWRRLKEIHPTFTLRWWKEGECPVKGRWFPPLHGAFTSLWTGPNSLCCSFLPVSSHFLLHFGSKISRQESYWLSASRTMLRKAWGSIDARHLVTYSITQRFPPSGHPIREWNIPPVELEDQVSIINADFDADASTRKDTTACTFQVTKFRLRCIPHYEEYQQVREREE